MKLRALAAGDVDDLLAIQHAQAGDDPRWSRAELHGQLFDDARAGGAQVQVAERDGAVLGAVGWVEALPWVYGAPCLAADGVAAVALIDHVVTRARAIGAARLRISATAGEIEKTAALHAMGFAPALDFLHLARPLAAGDGQIWTSGWRRVPWPELDVAAFAEARNASFVAVDNAPPLGVAAMRSYLDSDAVWREATAAWADDQGYVAVLVAEHDRDERGRFATVGEIGVAARARRQGVAARIVDDFLARAAAAGYVEARAMIASTNTPSLGLHRARGFVERSRRTVYELTLTPAPE